MRSLVRQTFNGRAACRRHDCRVRFVGASDWWTGCFGAFATVVLIGITSGCEDRTNRTGVEPNVQSVPASVSSYDGPSVADYAVFRPFFGINGADVDPHQTLATAFAMRVAADTDPVLVSVLHPAFTLSSPVLDATTSQAYRRSIRDVFAMEAYGAEPEVRKFGTVIETTSEGFSCGSIDDVVAEPEAEAEETLLNDLVLIASDSGRGTRPLALSESGPIVGDTVWMATSVYRGASPSVSAHAATVDEVSSTGVLSYQFTNPRLSLQAASGAPLLDGEGKVVGIHVTGTEKDGTPATGTGLSANCISQWWQGQPSTEQ